MILQTSSAYNISYRVCISVLCRYQLCRSKTTGCKHRLYLTFSFNDFAFSLLDFKMANETCQPCTECLDLLFTRNLSTERCLDDVRLVQATAKLVKVIACCSVVFHLLKGPAYTQNGTDHKADRPTTSLIISARCNIYILCLCHDVSPSVCPSVTFVHCGHRVRWIADIFAFLYRWMSLLLTDNA